MTYRELLTQKLMDNGATKQQTESKIVDIMITTLALESNPNLDQFAKILEEDRERLEEKTRELKGRERDIEYHEELNSTRNKDNFEELKKLREEEAELKSLRDQIDECETAEAKDRIRLADRFTEMIERKGGIPMGGNGRRTSKASVRFLDLYPRTILQ